MNYDIIDSMLRKRGMSRRQLALKAGIPESTMSSIFARKSQRISCDFLEKISAVLDVSVQSLLFTNEELTDDKEHVMGYQINAATIMAQIPQDEILAQMAEEASELAQACLKLRRAIRKDNPTPISIENAVSLLGEEWADVLLCKNLLTDQHMPCNAQIERIMSYKAQRWADRLREIHPAPEGGGQP